VPDTRKGSAEVQVLARPVQGGFDERGGGQGGHVDDGGPVAASRAWPTPGLANWATTGTSGRRVRASRATSSVRSSSLSVHTTARAPARPASWRPAAVRALARISGMPSSSTDSAPGRRLQIDHHHVHLGGVEVLHGAQPDPASPHTTTWPVHSRNVVTGR